MIELRDYQAAAVHGIRGAMAVNRRVLFVLPTGGGKTVVFSYIAQQAHGKGKRVMIVAHRKEIVRQISRSLDRFGVPHALVVPGATHSRRAIQVAMVQTLGRRISRGLEYEPDLLVMDEAHHGVAGSWATVAAAWPHAKILGVTATPQRLDGKGLSDAFDVIVEGPPVRQLIEAGHLARYRYLAPPMAATLKERLASIKKRYGDYATGDLAEAVDQRSITGDAVNHYAKYLNGRPAIVFCVSVAHAAHVRESFAASGYRAASVDGSMAAHERDRIIGDFASGRLNILTSCDLISEGFDVPDAAGVLLLRPTQSLSLHLQQVGRALRPKSDGREAVILDHAGNVDRHGLPDQQRSWTLAGKNDEAPSITTCRTCYRVMGSDEVKMRRATQSCAVQNEWDDCGIRVRRQSDDSERSREVEQRDGELEDVTRVEWAPGIDVVACTGWEFYALLARADSLEKLHQIARARGYRPGWAHVQWKLRKERTETRSHA